jgi:hypothetical protein
VHTRPPLQTQKKIEEERALILILPLKVKLYTKYKALKVKETDSQVVTSVPVDKRI